MLQRLRQNKLVSRVGLGVALILWGLFISMPCAVIALAVQREIIVTWSDVPEDNLRLWLIQDRAARGVGLSTARRVEVESGALCVITDTRFFLWQGRADNAHQCSCYQRDGEQRWQSMSTADGFAACLAAER